MNSQRTLVARMFLFLVVLAPAVCQAQHSYGLVLAEFGNDSNGEQTQTLVRYRFTGGVLAGKESILTKKTFDLRYDLGRNQVYQNRYVITHWGDVIDLATRQLLFKSKGTLVGIDKNTGSVIVRVDRADDHGIYAFDLTSHNYYRVEQPGLWAAEGIINPNRQMSASGDVDKIWVHRPNGKKVLLGSGFWREGTFSCSDFARPTFVWVDESRLLTQRGNGHLVVVDVSGKVEPLAAIADVEAPACGPLLQRDQENHIYYEDGRQAWLVDVAKRTLQPYLWQAQGNGFELEFQRNDEYGRVVRYRGSEIGRWWCEPGSLTSTAPGRIAVAYGEVGLNLGYPEGVKVWSAETGAWTTIKLDWLTAIIGWVEE